MTNNKKTTKKTALVNQGRETAKSKETQSKKKGGTSKGKKEKDIGKKLSTGRKYREDTYDTGCGADPCSWIGNNITRLDLFGHTPTLNINNKGSTYKSCFGGLVSILVRVVFLVVILGYVSLLGMGTVGYTKSIDAYNMQNEMVTLGSSTLMIAVSVIENNGRVKYDSWFRRHAEIRFVQTTIDLSSGTKQILEVKGVPCTKGHLDYNNADELICPDNSKD